MNETASNEPPSPQRRRPFYQDLTFQVVVGMALGVAVGAIWPHVGKELKPLGDVFIRLIQMVVGLIIFCTVTHGIASVRDLGKVGRIAIKAMVYFEVVTSIALVIGLVTINVLRPGVGMHIDPAMLHSAAPATGKAAAPAPTGFGEFLVGTGTHFGAECVRAGRHPPGVGFLGAVCLRVGKPWRPGAAGSAGCRRRLTSLVLDHPQGDAHCADRRLRQPLPLPSRSSALPP